MIYATGILWAEIRAQSCFENNNDCKMTNSQAYKNSWKPTAVDTKTRSPGVIISFSENYILHWISSVIFMNCDIRKRIGERSDCLCFHWKLGEGNSFNSKKFPRWLTIKTWILSVGYYSQKFTYTPSTSIIQDW